MTGTATNMVSDPYEWPICETHFALTIEPSSDAVPGSTVRLRYRARNVTAVASRPARVQFLLPPQIVRPVDGADIVDLAPLEPFSESIVECVVALRSPLDDGLALTFQAALLLDDTEPLGSNVVHLRVCSYARLDGPATRITVGPLAQSNELAVAVHVSNDGDGPAHGIVVVVPAPTGTHAIDTIGDPTFSIDRLEAGAGADFRYLARVAVGAFEAARVTEATIEHTNGSKASIAPSNAFIYEPALDQPHVILERLGNRISVRLDGKNTGFGAALQTAIAVEWPAELNCAHDSLAFDGMRVHPVRARHAFVTARVQSRRMDLTIGRIAARSNYAITFDLYATASTVPGPLVIDTIVNGERVGTCDPLLWTPRRDVRLRVLRGPDGALDAGARARVTFECLNAGDADETVSLFGDDAIGALWVEGKRRVDGVPIAIRAGCVITADVETAIPNDACDGAAFPVTLRAHDTTGEIACATATLIARDRVLLDTRCWLEHIDGKATLAITNRGASVARDVVVTCDADGTPRTLGVIAPGQTRRAVVDDITAEEIARGAVVTIDGRRNVRLESAGAKPAAPVAIEARISVPAHAHAGVAVVVTLHLRPSDDLPTLRIRATANAQAPTMGGSTSVNGIPIADRFGGSALHGEDGLLLHDVPAGTPVEVRWTVVPHAASTHDDDMVITVGLDGTGTPQNVRSEAVRVIAQRAFAPRAADVPFHIDGLTFHAPRIRTPSAALADPGDTHADEHPALTATPLPMPPLMPLPTLTSTPGITFALRLDDARIESLIRFLRGAAMPGLISHVFSLRALFAEVANVDAFELTQALAEQREAMRLVLDRLYVKMRIPGYEAAAADCEDATGRRAITALLDAVARVSTAPPFTDLADTLATTTMDGQTARGHTERIAREPLGSPASLAAMAAFLPTRAEHAPHVDAALGTYVEALRATFAEAEDAAPAAFDDRLAHGAETSLDARRAHLIDVLVDAGIRIAV